jgi:hypothetical protein
MVVVMGIKILFLRVTVKKGVADDDDGDDE